MTRLEVEALVEHIYATRLLNDPTKVAELFRPDATFHMSGATGPGSVSALVTGEAGLQQMMRILVSGWEWLEHTVLDLLVDGNRAAVRYRVKMRFVPTGDVIDTDLMDVITFADGKIASMIEFCDTATAARLVAKAQG